MHNTLDLRYAPLKFADPEPLRDTAQPLRRGECPFLGGVRRAIGSLRPWLAGLRDNRQARFAAGPIDDRTLNDIGLTRADILCPPKPSRKSRLGQPKDLLADL